jgi:hypothetical protein
MIYVLSASLKPDGSICPTCFTILKLCILPIQCTCVFRMVIRINSDYFLVSLSIFGKPLIKLIYKHILLP